MKKIIFVVFLLLPHIGFAKNLESIVHAIESEWATIYFASDTSDKKSAYTHLLNRITNLSKETPNNPELLFWQATIIASRAEHQNGIEALAAIHKAQRLLLKTIAIKPETMDGSAFVTLGTLYYLAPGWPIAFGDDKKAEQYLKKGLQINPNGIESNYYYGHFLLTQDRPQKALEHFDLALKGPVRKEQVFADTQLKEEVKKMMAQIDPVNPKANKNQIAALANPSGFRQN